MASILRALSALQRPEAARALSRRIGAPQQASARALAAAVPTLVGVFARMAASPAAARSLLASLEENYDGTALADVPGLLGQTPSASTEALLDAALGTRRGAAEAQIARSAGVGRLQASAVLAASASLLLEALGAARRERRWSARDLTRSLARELTRAEDAVPGSVGVLEEVVEGCAAVGIVEDVSAVGAQLLARWCGSGRETP